MNIEERIKQLEFRVELLYKNRAIDRFFFECKVTSSQYSHLMDFMDYVSEKICKGEEVSKDFFEDEILSIVPEKRKDYNFCKLLAEYWQNEYQSSKVCDYFYGI